MKKFNILKYLPIALLAATAFACEDYVDENLNVISENAVAPYVEFDSEDPLNTTEDGGPATVRITLPVTQYEDVAVAYALGGTAVYGTDYTIEGATAGAGGTITIPYEPEANRNDRQDVEINVINNEITDGEKTIILTLESAETASGKEVRIGKGTTEELVAKTIVIKDDDCPSELSGTYAAGNSCYASDSSVPVWTEQEKNGVYDVTDITGGYYAYAGAPNIPAVVVEKCGTLIIEDFSMYDGALNFTNMSGTVNDDGTLTIFWEETGFGGGASCTTTFTM